MLKLCKETIPEIEKRFAIRFSHSLEFPNPKDLEKVQKRSRKAWVKEELSIKQKWLSTYYQKAILEPFWPDVSIGFVNDTVGWGLFADRDYPAHAYFGEYTGVVRKRRGVDRENDYCFEYTIGSWMRNPYLIDAEGAGNHARFMNHSSTPNLEPMAVCVSNVIRIVFFALKEIPKGAELTYNYGDDYWKRRSSPS